MREFSEHCSAKLFDATRAKDWTGSAAGRLSAAEGVLVRRALWRPRRQKLLAAKGATEDARKDAYQKSRRSSAGVFFESLAVGVRLVATTAELRES